MPRLSPLTVLPLVLALTAPAAVRGQDVPPDTFRLGELVVTATRMPMPIEAVPASVTVLDGATLRRRGLLSVPDALRTVAGLSIVQSGSTGGLTSVFMRGGESDYVRVMIDGVPVNDPGGAVDLAHLATGDIERIEIVRGPTSVLYGSDAASGVIQIFTRRGTSEPRIAAGFGVGRQPRVGEGAEGASPSWDADATVTGRTGRVGYGLSASRLTTDGAYAFNNDYDNTTLGGRLDLSGTSSSASLTARWIDGTFHYPTNGAGALVDANQYRASESLLLGLEASHSLSPRLTAKLSFTSRSADHRIDDQPDNAADTLGAYALRVADELDRTAADLWLDYRPASAMTLTLGGAAEWQSSRNQTLSESSFGPFEDASENDRRNTAVYGQLVISPVSTVSVTAGGRIDDNDRFGAFRTWRAGVSWNVRAETRLRATAGSGFKEPTFYENFATGFVTGDPGLLPERTRSVEAGIEQALAEGSITLGATVFAQRFRNLIMYTFEPPPGRVSNYFNVGAARSNGVELSARWSVSGGLTAGVSWDWLSTKVTDEGFGEDRSFLQGRPLLRRPERSASFDLEYATARWNASVTIDRTGRRDDLDFSDPNDFNGRRITLDGVTTVNLAGGYELGGGASGRAFTLILRIDNLLDERFEEIINFPAAGRVLRLGLRSRIDP